VTECIHGFEAGLCDICFPRTAPAAATARAKTPTARQRTATTARGTTATIRRPAAPAVPALPPFATRRLYHLTHERNLLGIVADGAIRAGAEPEVDVSSATTRELRATTELPGDRSAAEFVPFYLTPTATRWRELVEGAEGAHWSDAARRARPNEYVALLVTGAALGDDLVVADGDAAATTTRFTAGADAGATALRRIAGVDPELQEAEVLAHGQVPFSAVVVLGVPNERIRDRIRTQLADLGVEPPRISVFPAWFQREA